MLTPREIQDLLKNVYLRIETLEKEVKELKSSKPVPRKKRSTTKKEVI